LAGRITATNGENASDKQKGNRKPDVPMQATQDHHGSSTGAVPESCSPSGKLLSEQIFKFDF
jgi:fused-like protein